MTSDEMKWFVSLICEAEDCKYNNQGSCDLKRVGLTEDGLCAKKKRADKGIPSLPPVWGKANCELSSLTLYHIDGTPFTGTADEFMAQCAPLYMIQNYITGEAVLINQHGYVVGEGNAPL